MDAQASVVAPPPARARAALERSVALVQSNNLSLVFSMHAAALGTAYALSGQVGQALPLLEQAVQHEASSLESRGTPSQWIAALSEGYRLAGRRDEAVPLAERTLEFLDHKRRSVRAGLLRLLGEIAVHRTPPDIDQAEAFYRQALALADELGMRPLVAHCHRSLGMLYAQLGQREQARAELSAAIDLYRAMDMTFWLPGAEAALAQVEGR